MIKSGTIRLCQPLLSGGRRLFHRKYQHRYDRIAYKQRWDIEGFFAKLKQWRRIATCYDKIAPNFLGFVKLASIMLWIK